MLCPYCGKVNPDDHGYCLYCGATGLQPAMHTGKSVILPRLSDDFHQGVYEITEQFDSVWSDQDSAPDASSPSPITDRSLHIHTVESENNESFGENELLADAHYPVPRVHNTDPYDERTILPASFKNNVEPDVPVIPARTTALSPSAAEEKYLSFSLGDSYEIVKKIGVGGMASVYLAREAALDRLVAVKVLSQVYQSDDELVRRFRREAKIAARLEHPNIVSIHRVGGDENICWFVMKYIPGGTLSERLKTSGIISLDDIVRWGSDMCSALAYAHSHGVIHRDIKPDNILIDKNGHAIITDFGIASATGGTQLTRTGAVLGTPQYMSPDQACGRPLDQRSDIYSLGILLYRMATGTLPFDAGDPLSIMFMHVNKPPLNPEMVNPHIPLWLSDIILTCIEKKPDDRFSQISDVHAALLNRSSHRRVHSQIVEGFRDDAKTLRRFFGDTIQRLSHFPALLKKKKEVVSPEPTVRVPFGHHVSGSRHR